MEQAYIIDGVRTPIGAFGGSLANVRADDMAAHVIAKLLARHQKFDPAAITDVVLGCANQAGEDNRNVARMALLLAGLPESVPGETVNRLCASGLSAIASAARGIQLGEGAVYIAGGVENMTRAPFVLSKSPQAFARSAEIFDTSIGWRFVNKKMKERYGTDSMGETAENVAEKYGVSRLDQDQFAFNSQQKATKARAEGRFAKEIAPIEIPAGKKGTAIFEEDEYIRPDTTPEGLAKLNPAFRLDGYGTVSAGNASGINDGACAVIVASSEAAKRYGWNPQSRIVGVTAVGVTPKFMGIGPVPAVRKLLDVTGVSLDKIGIIEINEAFAAQGLACIRELGLRDGDSRINPNGGAIALGHPLGMSGARLALTATHELHFRQERYALCTMCVGVGQGMAMLLEKV